MTQARSLPQDEIDALLEKVGNRRHGQRNQLILQFMYWAGLRVGEVAALTIANVVERDGRVKREIRLEAHQTKGDRGRVVVLPRRLQESISIYLAGEKKSIDKPLFLSQKRVAFTADTLQGVLSCLYKSLGYDGCSSHSGRRSFLTNLAAHGVSARVLQELAGHRHLATTQRYIDVNDAMKREAVELI